MMALTPARASRHSMQQPVPIVPVVQPLLFEFPQAMGLSLERPLPIPPLERSAIRRFDFAQRPERVGRTGWQAEVADRFGLGSTLRPRGRLRNEEKSCLSLFVSLALKTKQE
jgi:hypothetical protein